METYIGIGVLALFIIGVIVIVILGKKRKRELKEVADSLGFSFSDEFLDEDDDLLKSLSQLNLFSQSKSQSAWNIMQGHANGIAVTIMDHRYSSSGSGSPGRVSEQTVIVFQSDQLRLPSFTLRPEDLALKMSTALLGYTDINFDSHPEFSKQYHLNGCDEEAIRGVFGEAALSYYQEHSNFSTDGHRDQLVFCRLSRTVSAQDIRSFLDQGFEVLRLFNA